LRQFVTINQQRDQSKTKGDSNDFYMAVDFRIAPTGLKIRRWTPDFLDMLAQVGGLIFILYLILRMFVKTITDVKILY
jgi:hypothetical protein